MKRTEIMQNLQRYKNERKALQRREQKSTIFTQIGNPSHSKWRKLRQRCRHFSLDLPQTQTHFSETDGWTDAFFWYSLMLKEGDPACSMPIHSTPACDPGITWTIGKCLGRFVLKVCLHLACLVILFEDTEIQGLWSGFDEPESSLAHVEMLWHCWYHPNTVERSVGRVFT